MVALLFAGSRRRRFFLGLLLGPLLLAGLWLAIHRIPGFGPWLADGARAIFGNRAVAWVEDVAYGAEDWVNRKTRADAEPATFWDVPAGSASAGSKSRGQRARGAFRPKDVGPVHATVTAPGDGSWVPIGHLQRPDDPARMYKTQLHPDKNRSWAVVAVVAVDLTAVELHLVAGAQEPEARTPEAKAYSRRALIDDSHHDALLAAFNGGYKATHGHYGMEVDGVTLVPPRSLACVVARMLDGRIVVRPWDDVAADEPSMKWWRQTPVCMIEDGEPSPLLSMSGYGWGASSVSGTTVIRRSAIGIDTAGKVLFVGIGDHTTASAIATAVRHAGASQVAQLDVNFSFPKFVTFQPRDTGSGELVAVPLTDHFEYTEDEFIRQRAPRDFFYLTAR